MSSKYAPHLERLSAVAGASSGRRFAVAGARDGRADNASKLHIFNAAKATHTVAVDVPVGIDALVFAADDLLVVGGADGTLRALDAGAATPTILLTLPGPGGAVTALVTDAQGQVLVVGTATGRAAAYRLEVVQGTPTLALLGERAVSLRPLRCAVIDAHKARFAVGGDDGIVRVLPLETLGDDAVRPREMPMGEGGVGALVATDDGRVIAGCGDGTVRVCFLDGAPDQEDRSGAAAHERPVRGLVLGPVLRDEARRLLPRRLFSVGEDGVLKSWPLDSRRKPKTVELGSRGLLGLAWVPGSSRAKAEKRGGLLIGVDDDRTITLLTLDDKSDPADEVVRIRGQLAEHAERLGASSTKVREAALTSLSAVPEDEARVLIERALAKDGKETVRTLAAEALGLGMRRRSRPVLRAALNDSAPKVRAAAYEALELIDEREPLAPARAAAGSRHADMRVKALAALPALRDVSPTVPGLIAALLSDGEAAVRHAALDALYAIEPDHPIDAARTALARGPEDIRAMALLRLGRSRATEQAAAYALVEDALDDEAKEVRRVAFLVCIAARPELGRRLYAADPAIARAVDTLHRDGVLLPSGGGGAKLTDEALAPLFAALICRQPETALRGARALALLQDPRASGALLQLSRESSAALRKDVVAALRVAAVAMPGDERLRTRLQWLLDDGDVGVRADAFDALAQLAEPLGDVGALRTAALALRSGQADMRERAMAIVVRFGPGASPSNAATADALLGAALDDEADKVRSNAFATLWTWHSDAPQIMLERASTSRHADIRGRVVAELGRRTGAWADTLLLAMVPDPTPEVGLAAYLALTQGKNKARVEAYKGTFEAHQAAMGSPRASVRAAGCRGARHGVADALRPRLLELLEDESAEVHDGAIEALDALEPNDPRAPGKDQHAFVLAYGSKFWGLRVRAAELHAKRRDPAAMAPMAALVALPEGDRNRPSPQLRQRAAAAMADVGDAASMSTYVTLLDDADPLVREMGARGLAGAVAPGLEQPLVAALSHDDLPVRSWVAEGLARMGDARAVPVLAGTLSHDHKPIRLGAILSFVALGPDGVVGIMHGLEDRDREVQELVFAIVLARDLSLARKGLAPDLLMAALAASSPELRFVAARALEVRSDAESLDPLVEELIGPRKPDRAAELSKWPSEDERRALLNVLAAVLASEDPAQRYAAARVLSVRPQPAVFWREAKRLRRPVVAGGADTPPLNPAREVEDPTAKPRARGWIRRLGAALPSHGAPATLTERALDVIRYVGGPSPQPVPPADVGTPADLSQLVFGTYVGLVRQAPAAGEADQTHRVRRDSLARLSDLAALPEVGRVAVLPVLRRALSDPNHLVRKTAVTSLHTLYEPGDVTPASLALGAQFADVGRAAVDELVALALDGHERARSVALGAVDAPSREVRKHAVTMLQRLFDSGALEPWLVALNSRYADVRLSVVDRLADARDARVDGALARALQSDHEDLRLRAALALARRGDGRSVDVLAAFLRADDARTVTRATEAMAELVVAPGGRDAAGRASLALATRIEEDPDKTADRGALVRALGRVGHADGAAVLLRLVADKDAALAVQAFAALMLIARHPTEGPRTLDDGRTRKRYDDARALSYLQVVAALPDPQLRTRAVAVLADVDDAAAEDVLARLLDDRAIEVRVAAAETLAFRAEAIESAGLEALDAALRQGRRELVLPAAEGLASRRRPEALQALLLVLKAGEPSERERALLSLGQLGDPRSLPDVEVLLDPDAELSDEDRALAPAAVESLGRMLARLAPGSDRDRVRTRVETLAAEAAPKLRARAMTGLRWAGDARSRGLLEATLADRFDNASIRTHAATLLGQLGDVEAEASLADAVETAERAVAAAAAVALDRLFPDDRTRVHMIRLRSRHAELAGASAMFLARHAEPESLLSRLCDVDDHRVRRRLRRGLVRRGALPVAPISALLRAADPGPRTDGAWLAGASADPGLSEPSADAARLSEAQWREARAASPDGLHPSAANDGRAQKLAAARDAWRASLWAVQRVGGDGSLELARSALADKTPATVQCQALRLLERVGSAEDLPLARERLTSPHAAVRMAAAQAGLALDGTKAAAWLTELRGGDGNVVATLASTAPDAAAQAWLVSDAVRPALLPAMLAETRTAPLSAAALAEGKPAVRTAAITALGRLAGAQAVATLTGLAQDDALPEAVRKAAYRSLRRAQRTEARAAALAQMEETQ